MNSKTYWKKAKKLKIRINKGGNYENFRKTRTERSIRFYPVLFMSSMLTIVFWSLQSNCRKFVI